MTTHQVVRHKIGKLSFEILTKPGAALKYREGKLEFSEVLFIEEIFKNPTKGERYSSEELKDAFGTDSAQECMKIILDKGDLQLSALERKEKIEKKRAEIVNYIHKYYADPKTKTPHPVIRIENALVQLKVKVDPDIPSEKQAHEVLKKLPEILPLKKLETQATLTVQHRYTGVVNGIIQPWCKIIKENYTTEGSVLEISFVPGDYDSLMNSLQRSTKGEFQFEIVGQEKASSDEIESEKQKKKGNIKPKRK